MSRNRPSTAQPTATPADAARPSRSGALGRAAAGATVAAAALFVAAPLVAVFAGALAGGGEAQAHIWSTAGPRYFATTVYLCLLVAVGTTVVGAGAAMLISLTEFPGRRFLSVTLVLPFAVPAYVAAYVYGDFLGPFGPAAAVVGPRALPEIRSLGGAAFILVLTTYPYVYLAMRASLSARSAAFMESARMLGASPASAARRVLLSAGRPALIGGLALALMETAAEFGVADYFGVQTLSVGIFRTWYGLGDLTAATQLAAGLFLAALMLVLLEESGRRAGAMDSARALRGRARLRLSPLHAAAAFAACAAPVAFGFLLPAGVLLAMLDPDLTVGAARGLMQSVANTALVGAAGAGAAITLAVALAYAGRTARSAAAKTMLRIATFGYAIPGAVIAIGVLALTAGLSRFTGVAVAGGIAILIYAYVARFLTAGYNMAAGGLAQVSPQMDAAAKSLGASDARILTRLHLPLTRGAILAGAAIVAIDIAKELPATLLLRPFNFETLSTRIYRLASDERLADAAPAALILIALSLVPALALSLFSEGGKAARVTPPRDKRGADRPARGRDSAHAA